MAKTYLNTVKYEIQATYEVDGIVDKPDIIGAVFGQSEGLLGEDMDLKELQQAGKLGRIEITVNKGKGKTTGEIIIPSSLDQVKTSILAAAVETVEKVGPCDTKVKINKIIDTRKDKREKITGRAKELLKKMQKFEGVETDEIAQGIRSDIRTQKVVEINGLFAGPEVETSNSIIVVEGRADVIKLLSYGINNAIAMNGSNIEKSLIDLCNTKEVIILIDGDRGGEMNVQKLGSMTKVDFVAKAPDGKEVEELTQKEILQALKRRQDFKTYGKPTTGYQRNYPTNNSFQRQGDRGFQSRNYSQNNYTNNRSSYGNDRSSAPRNNYRNDRPSYGNNGPQGSRNSYGHSSYGSDRPSYGNNRGFGQRSDFRPRGDFRGRESSDGPRFDPFQGNYRPRIQANANTETQKIQDKTGTIKTPVKKSVSQTTTRALGIEKDYDKIKGSLKARFYDSKKNKIKDVQVKEVVESLEKGRKKVETIVFDGIITKRLIDAAEKQGVKNVVGAKKGTATSDKVNVYTM